MLPRGRSLPLSIARRASSRPAVMSTQSSNAHRRVMSGSSSRPGSVRVEPLSIRRNHGSASLKSHWIVAPPFTVALVSTERLIRSNRSATFCGSRLGGPVFSPMNPASSIVSARSTRSSGVSVIGSGGAPGSSSSGRPAARIFDSNDCMPWR